MRIERNGCRGAGQFEREIRGPARGNDVAWRHLHLELDTIGADDAKERCAFVVRRAERRVHFGETSANRRAQRERITGGSPATSAQRFITLGETGLRRAQARLGDDRCATRVFRAPGRYGTFGEQTFSPGLFQTGAVECGTGLGDFRVERGAIGSGRQARLEPAKQLTGLRAEILSVPIAWEGPRVQAYVSETIETARRRFGLAVQMPSEVRILDGYQGVGRAEVKKEELDLLLRLARLEGILLDPVYTAKAFGGLLDVINRHPGWLGRRVCFIHTGGVFSVFPFRDSLGPLVDA